MQSDFTKPKICFRCGQQHENNPCTADKPKCSNCKGEHPSNSKNCPKIIEKKLVMKKVFVEKCTPHQARVDLKTKSKPDNKPKGKVTKQTKNKVTVPTVNDTVDVENIDNLVLFSVFSLG